ncbi:MAG TPA: DUF3105 domain-containing protein [Candidatus Saccharimonadales bacterium]|nr:DUF3105 domain-containing protein [Candidatus Saccharimonadales bacterium]
MSEKSDLSGLTKKQRQEYLRNLKTSSGTTNMTKYLIAAGIVIFVAAALWGLFVLSSNSGSSVKELGEKVAAPAAPNDHAHVKKGDPHVPYTSNPPSSGPHYNGIDPATGIGPVVCQTYTHELDDESAVHNLEHGAVWVTYKDINDKALADQLKKITQRYSKVLLSPRGKDDSKIALVSWERVLKLDKFDEQKITDFIKLYRSSEAAGAERFAQCGTVAP